MDERKVSVEAWRHPAERPTRTALLVIGCITAGLAIILTMGLAALVAGLMALSTYVSIRLMRAHWLSHGARVGPGHFPHIHEAVEDVRARLGYSEPLEVYVIQATLINAFVACFMGTRFMVLFSQLVEGVEENPEQLRALVAHEMAHIAAGHFRLRFLMMAGAWVPLLWNAWSRSGEYTADRLAYACSNSLEATERVLAMLSVGWRLARHVDTTEMIGQANEASASLAARYLELTSSHPLLVKRLRAIRAVGTGTEAQIPPEPAGLTFAAGALAIPGSCAPGSASGAVVVLVVIAVLAAILFPVFARSREKARQASCVSNLKQIALAALMYTQDYDEVLPPHSGWPDHLEPYIKNQLVYRCPSEPELRLGYEYAPSLGRETLASVQYPARTLLMWDARGEGATLSNTQPAYRHNRGLNASYVDGHVKWAGREQFEELLSDSPKSQRSPDGANLR